jgi:hypothetical protein
MPASIEIKGDLLLVHIQGSDRLWALKSRMELPLTNVIGATSATAEAREWLHGLRLGGTHVPGVVSAGRFYSDGKWAFWDVHDPDKAIAIELRDERYSQLVIEVDDPDEEIQRVRQTRGAREGNQVTRGEQLT